MILSKITPVTVAEEGRNSFRIEARLTESGPHLRPGMEGVAKIETGQRSLVLDLDARHRRMAESRRLEVLALSAGK